MRRLRTFLALGVAWLGATAPMRAADRLELVWPTPLTAWTEGKPADSFLQHAGSGDPASGGFGGVRSSGTQFHEGLDIRPVSRDRRGEPTDPVFAALPGIVRHVSNVAGNSSYGRYVVLEHPGVEPAIYTLYAHLARVASEVKVGANVTAGQTLGLMGHTAGGYTIPKNRSHLHFEIGLAATRDFQAWYNRQKFGSRNEHGMWNGMNLLGVDPLEFFDAWRDRRIATARDFFAQMPTVVRLRIATLKKPDFITRYPALLTRPLPVGLVAGWEIRFNWTGLPFAWTPLMSEDVADLPAQRPQILEVDAEVERRQRSKSLAVNRQGKWTVGRDLETVLEQLFGSGLKL